MRSLHEHASLALSLLLGGGPILFLAAQGWYLWAVPNVRSQLHLIGGVALLLVGLATLAVPPYAALILVGASLTRLSRYLTDSDAGYESVTQIS